MDYQKMIDQMSPQLYRMLKISVETGRWPDGGLVTAEQRGHAMQAMIVWGEKNLTESERVGYIDKGSKAGGSCDSSVEMPLAWSDSSHD